MNLRTTAFVFLLVGSVCGIGCHGPDADRDNAQFRQMVELLMPQRIEIVEAFTALHSFDDDSVPDGIELLIQPIDSYGDPVKVAGTLRAELYTYRQASGNREGDRLCEPWEINLLTEEQQKQYWNPVTGMYDIPLQLPRAARADRGWLATGSVLVVVTYSTPLSTHMTDECVLQVPSSMK